jgi:hypothetical protein
MTDDDTPKEWLKRCLDERQHDDETKGNNKGCNDEVNDETNSTVFYVIGGGLIEV